MQAARHPLEQFLVRLPGSRKNHRFIRAERTDQAVGRNQRAERARVDVGARHVFRTPDLPRRVSRGRGPRTDVRHAGQAAVEKQETFRQIVVDVRPVRRKPGEPVEPHTRLRPVRFGTPVPGIAGLQAEINFVSARRDHMVDGHPVGQRVAQSERAAVVAENNPFNPMGDHGVLDPVGIGGAGAAVRFDIIDPDLPARQ